MALTITPAALHAALMLVAQAMGERRHEAAESGVEVLLVMTDPSHQASPLVRAAPVQGDRAEPGPDAAGEAIRPEAGTPAPPTIDLPAGPAEGVPSARGGRRAIAADDDLLRELWPLPTTLRELHEAFNARAVRPLKSDVRFYERARRLGLPLPRHQAMVAAGHTVARRGMVKGVWTDEREAMLRDRYPNEGITPALLDALNALAGPEIVSANALKAHAHRLGLALTPDAAKRKGAGLAAHARSAIAARRSERRAELVAMTTPEPPPPAPPPPAPITADDEKRDVFDAFDAGLTVRRVADDFGTPLSTLTNWHAEWKRSRGKAA